jgi:hypothetical protein
MMVAGVVAVLLVSVAGINSVRNRNAVQSATEANRTQFDQRQNGGDAAAGSGSGAGASDDALTGPNPVEYVGNGLDCSKLPDGRMTIGHRDDVTLESGQPGYLYEFLCIGSNGQRSASELLLFEEAGGTPRHKETLLRAAANQHLQSIIGGAGMVRMEASDHSTRPGGVPGKLISTTWALSDSGRSARYTFTVAEPCGVGGDGRMLAAAGLRSKLPVTVSEVPDATAPAWVLSIRNGADASCAIEGFPQVRALRGGATLTTAAPAMSGAVGGVTKSPTPPIILLPPGATASAILEQGTASGAGSCPRSDQLALTLPNGVSLGQTPVELSGCGLVVHPLVGNARGSD